MVGHNVRDLLADGPHLWALSANAETGQFALHDLRNPNSPPHQGRFSETLLRAFKTPNGVGVLTVQSIYTLTGERWERIPLSTPVDSHTSHVAAGGPGTIFLGTDLGEFGGSLHRLATTSGQVWTYGVTGQDPCEADFDPECDPIVGLLPDANHPGCVVAASGQFHMGMTHGRIFRVCENSMTVTYVTPNRTPWLERWLPPNDVWSGLTAPITSLTQTRDGWVAMSSERYFQFSDGQVHEHGMPDFRYWHDLRISDENNGVMILVGHASGGPADFLRYWPIAIPVVE